MVKTGKKSKRKRPDRKLNQTPNPQFRFVKKNLKFLRKVKENIIDIIYNSQLNEFVIHKFQVLSRRGYSSSQYLRKTKEYSFVPEKLQELVTMRASFEDFKHTLRYMNKSNTILRKLGRKKKNDQFQVKIPIGKIFAKKKQAKILDSNEKSAVVNLTQKLIENGEKKFLNGKSNKKNKSKTPGIKMKGKRKRKNRRRSPKKKLQKEGLERGAERVLEVLEEFNEYKKLEKLELELDLKSIKDFTSCKAQK